MDVFLLLFLLLCLIGVKLAPRGTLFNGDRLERSHTVALRGLLSILIVLDHSSLLTGCGHSVIVLKRAGPYVVALFYALSSYGLLASYIKNGYTLKGYWKKRVQGTIIPYLLLYAAAVLIRLLIKEAVSVKEILLSFVNGHPLIPYSWFILTIVGFYLIFYLSALLAKRDLDLLLALVSFAVFVSVFVLKKLGFEDFWFNAAWGIPLGLVWQRFYRSITSAFQRHPWVYLTVTGLTALWWILIAEYFFWFGYLARLCSTLSVSVFALLLMCKFRIGNPILRFFGKISLEIYLIHGLLVFILKNLIAPERQPYLFVSLLLAGTILLSWLFHTGYSRMIRTIRRHDDKQA